METFDASIQVESILQMIWLLYSFNSLDLNVLVVVLEEEVEAPVALRLSIQIRKIMK